MVKWREESCSQHWLRSTGISFQGQIQLVAFCMFEFCVGLFWPSMMKMRAAHVPEEMRATIINFFRIPLNLFVCVVLYNVSLLHCLSAMHSHHFPMLGLAVGCSCYILPISECLAIEDHASVLMYQWLQAV